MATLAVGIAATAEAGSIIYVDDDSCAGPGGDGTIEDPYCSIQTGIDAAMDGDEVVVAPGTYFETINFLGKAIWLHSLDGPNVTIIDAEQTGTVVTCDSAEGPDSVLEGFTITGGIGGFGGGMRNINSNPTVTACIFTANAAAGEGGGMYNDGSSPTVTNCTFSGNSAVADVGGGGMYNNSSSPTVTNCTFSGNTAVTGGGMVNSASSSPTVTNCTFSGNTGGAAAGGMFNSAGSSPTVTNCTFSGNTGGIDGGGMFNSNVSDMAVVANCTFSGNSAGGDGGGMHNQGSSPTVTNCTFSRNTAHGNGGGMSNWSSNPTVINCTFSNNTADFGGGMYNWFDSSPTVTNCVLWNNSPDEVSGDATVSYSDVEGGWPGTGNIDADPVFVAPGIDDYRLSSGSPCIDAADNSAVPKGIDTDLDGNLRFVDDPCTDDTGNGDPPIVDMGAYEFQVTCPWDLDCNGSVGVGDLLFLLGAWGPCPPKEGCPADFDGSGDVGVKDLLILLGNWGPCP